MFSHCIESLVPAPNMACYCGVILVTLLGCVCHGHCCPLWKGVPTAHTEGREACSPSLKGCLEVCMGALTLHPQPLLVWTQGCQPPTRVAHGIAALAAAVGPRSGDGQTWQEGRGWEGGPGAPVGKARWGISGPPSSQAGGGAGRGTAQPWTQALLHIASPLELCGMLSLGAVTKAVP